MGRLSTVTAGLALGVATLATSATVFAQFPRATPPSEARIVSGNDTGAPTGTWMLRVKCEWVEIGSLPGIRPAK